MTTATLMLEEGQRNGLAHGFVAGGGRVEMISAIISGEETVGAGRIAHDYVKVDYRVEVAWGSDPLIYSLAVGFALGTGVIVV